MTPQDRIKFAVAKAHGMSAADLVDKVKRRPRYVRARRELYWRLQQELGWSSEEIAEYAGGRDHSSVLHALKTLRKGTIKEKCRTILTVPIAGTDLTQPTEAEKKEIEAHWAELDRQAGVG